MNKTETALVDLVRLHYKGDERSFDQLVRNLVARGGRGDMTPEAQVQLRNAVPQATLMGNVLR